MELWLDTINLNAIKDANEIGILTGVTTNPITLSHADMLPEAKLAQLLNIQNSYVATQVVANSLNDILKQARQLAHLDKLRMIIKIPVNPTGLRAIKILSTEGISTLATAVFEPSQVYLASLAGANYIAPYINQMSKELGEYSATLGHMLEIIKTQLFPVKLMAASIALKEQILTCAKLGAHAITLSEESYYSLVTPHYLTEKSLERFKKAWTLGHYTQQSELFAID